MQGLGTKDSGATRDWNKQSFELGGTFGKDISGAVQKVFRGTRN